MRRIKSAFDADTGSQKCDTSCKPRHLRRLRHPAHYDPQVDVLTVVFSDAPVEESNEVKPGVILDYDLADNVVGLEIPDASHRVANPAAMEFAVRAA